VTRALVVIVMLLVSGLAVARGATQREATPEPARSDATATGALREQKNCSPPFGVDRWPDACWRPYGRRSPFNQRLPAKPVLSPHSARVVRRLTEQGGPSDLALGVADSGSDWEHPTYYARRSDPLFELHCYERNWGRCAIEGDRVRIPDPARRAGGGDGHLAVIDQANGWEYDLYQVRSKPKGGGVLEMRWGGRTRAWGRSSTGLGSDATAAHFGLLAGVIRPQELAAGRIRHALFIRANCDSGRAVYPARGLGARCDDPAGAPAEGARFQLALSTAEIDALGVRPWKRTILRAMARYGFFVGDTGGSPWDVALESGSTFTSFGRPDPWVALARTARADRSSAGHWTLDLAAGIDWSRHLRLIDPCVSRRAC
jgi:hypothetical protein